MLIVSLLGMQHLSQGQRNFQLESLVDLLLFLKVVVSHTVKEKKNLTLLITCAVLINKVLVLRPFKNPNEVRL